MSVAGITFPEPLYGAGFKELFSLNNLPIIWESHFFFFFWFTRLINLFKRKNMKRTLIFATVATIIVAAVMVACNKVKPPDNETYLLQETNEGEFKSLQQSENPWDFRGIEHNEVMARIEATFDDPDAASHEEIAAIIYTDLNENERNELIQLMEIRLERVGDDPFASFDRISLEDGISSTVQSHLKAAIDEVLQQNTHDLDNFSAVMLKHENTAMQADILPSEAEDVLTVLAIWRHSAKYWHYSMTNPEGSRYNPPIEGDLPGLPHWLKNAFFDAWAFLDQVFGHENGTVQKMSAGEWGAHASKLYCCK